jgi:putative aminopeptidase FrvX
MRLKIRRIPVQLNASSTSAGTDTDAFAYSNSGVPSALISTIEIYAHYCRNLSQRDDIKV